MCCAFDGAARIAANVAQGSMAQLMQFATLLVEEDALARLGLHQAPASDEPPHEREHERRRGVAGHSGDAGAGVMACGVHAERRGWCMRG